MKTCKITNDSFSWRLEVDNKIINFNGSDNAEYFATLYHELGYDVMMDKDLWKRKQQEALA